MILEMYRLQVKHCVLHYSGGSVNPGFLLAANARGTVPRLLGSHSGLPSDGVTTLRGSDGPTGCKAVPVGMGKIPVWVATPAWVGSPSLEIRRSAKYEVR